MVSIWKLFQKFKSNFTLACVEQDYSLDKYEEELEKIARQERNYTPYVVAICTGFACGGFCKLFGGDWIAFRLRLFVLLWGSVPVPVALSSVSMYI